MKKDYTAYKYSFLRLTSCVLILGTAYYSCNMQGQAAANKTVFPAKTVKAANYTPVLPAPPLRNPFLSSRAISNKAISAQEAVSAPAIPILRGIITHGDQTAGIFEYAGQSSYHIAGDKIGPYIIKALTLNSATILTDSQQQISLKLEG